MPKILCRCGKVIGLGEIPSSNQWMIISDTMITDEDWDDNGLNMSDFYKKMDIVVKCPECKRLYIYSKGFDNEPEVYNLEE